MDSIFVNGKLLAEKDAVISTFDHGLVVGDGAFETVLLHRGRPFALQRHLARLNRSLDGLLLDSVDAEQITEEIDQVVSGCDFTEGRIRITVTAGNGPLGSGRYDSELSVVIAAAPTTDAHEHAQVHTVPWPRNEQGALVGLKTISYAENAVALAYAATRGADEAIFANTLGNLCEGSGSNVFVVINDELTTPPLSSGCLGGITRGLVLECAAVSEHDLPIGDFTASRLNEAFLTSAIRGVQPIHTIDGVALAQVPGPQTSVVMERYNRLSEETPNP